jgi:hypothetical protein
MSFDENRPFICVSDNDEALAEIIARGLIGKFPQYAGPDASHIAAVLDPSHPSHWLLACHFVGHTVKNVKSPYAIFGFLKTEYSVQKIKIFAENMVATFGGTEPPTEDYPRPDRN